MDVSIIIVNYKTATLVIQAIESVLEKNDGFTYEIIVVDNNSEDHLSDLLSKKFQDRVQCICLRENIGFGRANNEGIVIAKGKYILFLNPDTILRNNAVKVLGDYLDNHPEAGIVGGNLFDEEIIPTHSYGCCIPSLFTEVDALFKHLFSRLIFGENREFNSTKHPRKVGYITGADLMIRKSIITEVGAFDPDFFMYWEESELTFRVKKAGWEVINVPQAQIIHLEGKSFKFKSTRELFFQEGRKLYYLKTHNGFYLFLANLVQILLITSRITFFSILNSREKKETWKMKWKIFLEVYRDNSTGKIIT